MRLALLQQVVEVFTQSVVAAQIVERLINVAFSLCGDGTMEENGRINLVDGVSTETFLHLVVDGEHLVVIAQLAPCRGYRLAPIEGLAVLALLVEREIVAGVGYIVDVSVGVGEI